MEYQRISGSDFLPTRGDHAPVEIFGSGVRKDMPEVRSGGRPEAAPNSSDSDAHRCHQHLLLRRSRQTLSTPRSNGAGGPGPGPPAPFDRGECMPLRAKRSSSASARLEEVSGSPPFSLCGGQRKAGLRFWSHWGLLALTSTRLGLAGMTAKTDLAMALPGPPHKSEAWILGTSNFARPQRCWADAFRRPSHRASAPFVRPPPRTQCRRRPRGFQFGRKRPEAADDIEGPDGLKGDIAPDDGDIASGRRRRSPAVERQRLGQHKRRAAARPLAAAARPAAADDRAAKLPRPSPHPHAAPRGGALSGS